MVKNDVNEALSIIQENYIDGKKLDYNAVFKSGTNAYHGSAWYYFRDSGLNANSWVNNRVGLEKPDDPLKYWGGQVGGPILKDKLFFYFTANRETDKQPYSQTGLFAPCSNNARLEPNVIVSP